MPRGIKFRFRDFRCSNQGLVVEILAFGIRTISTNSTLFKYVQIVSERARRQ
jgi:hypothetical protein